MTLRAIFIVLVSAVLVAGCSAPRIELEPRSSPSQIEGNFSTGSSTVSVEDLGLDEDGVQVGGEIDLKWGSPHLTASYAPNSFNGNSTLTAPLTVGGSTIPSGSSVATDLKLDISSAVLTFDLLPIPTLELGLGLGVAVIDFRNQVRETMGSNSIDTSATLPVPLLAGRVAWDFWRFKASVLASGFSYAASGDSVDYYDVDAELRFNFIGHDSTVQGWISAGYRQIGSDIAYDDSGSHVRSDITLKGPYLGLVLGF